MIWYIRYIYMSPKSYCIHILYYSRLRYRIYYMGYEVILEVIHLMVELRAMVASIVACLRPLIWAAVLFGMLVYTVAVTPMHL